VKNALEAGRRDFSFEQENDDDDDDDDNRWDWDDEFQAPVFGDDDDEQEERAEEAKETRLKPEAQFRPWLFVQERLHGGSSSSSGRSRDKAELSVAIQELAEERGVPVAAVDKGVLNTLSGNRPHQGAVLRCGPLDVETISRIPPPGDGGRTPSLWLVLDEVVDPQNLGALIRSAHFLGGSEDARIGILVCTKNSAPLSAVVSAASAGALEVATLYATSNLPRTLSTAEQDGFRIVGASATSPQHGDEVPFYDLQDMPGRQQDSRPTLLVLGSEGHGLRHLVATHCTEFVRIPGAAVGVDSLNVSVTGGILLWHLLHGRSSA
jgi:21S rRNA (GM2251-2'-O)-methyltransferase